MAWLLVIWLDHGLATAKTHNPAHCWTLLGGAIAAAREDEESGVPFPIKWAACKRRRPARSS
jgi:hypothetical protein